VWTKQLIDTLEPEMIIAEGFKAFNEIAVLFPEKIKFEKGENIRSFEIPSGMKVLGYKRNKGSIIGKEEIISVINTKD
jgi:hypothetical protein